LDQASEKEQSEQQSAQAAQWRERVFGVIGGTRDFEFSFYPEMPQYNKYSQSRELKGGNCEMDYHWGRTSSQIYADIYH
jgi:hypothetical protein